MSALEDALDALIESIPVQTGYRSVSATWTQEGGSDLVTLTLTINPEES